MLAIKTMRHIATRKTIPSFRSCPSLSQVQERNLDAARQLVGRVEVLTWEARRCKKA